MQYLVLFAALLLYALIRGTLHPYYIVLSLPFLLIAVVTFFRTNRSAAERRKRNRDRSKPGVVGPILAGVLAASLIIPATSLLANALKPTPVYGFFYDLDHDGFMTRINTLKSAQVVDWSQIETLATERTDMPLPPDQMDEIDALVLEAMIGQARQAPSWPSKAGHYDRAITWANDHEKLSPDLALAERANAEPKPTPTPPPTYTPQPTLVPPTPYPTLTPQATYTPAPTYTPGPTAAATNTPLPGTVDCNANPIDSSTPPQGIGWLIVLNDCTNKPGWYRVDWYPVENIPGKVEEPPYNRMISPGGPPASFNSGGRVISVGVDNSSGKPRIAVEVR